MKGCPRGVGRGDAQSSVQSQACGGTTGEPMRVFAVWAAMDKQAQSQCAAPPLGLVATHPPARRAVAVVAGARISPSTSPLDDASPQSLNSLFGRRTSAALPCKLAPSPFQTSAYPHAPSPTLGNRGYCYCSRLHVGYCPLTPGLAIDGMSF